VEPDLTRLGEAVSRPTGGHGPQSPSPVRTVSPPSAGPEAQCDSRLVRPGLTETLALEKDTLARATQPGLPLVASERETPTRKDRHPGSGWPASLFRLGGSPRCRLGFLLPLADSPSVPPKCGPWCPVSPSVSGGEPHPGTPAALAKGEVTWLQNQIPKPFLEPGLVHNQGGREDGQVDKGPSLSVVKRHGQCGWPLYSLSNGHNPPHVPRLGTRATSWTWCDISTDAHRSQKPIANSGQARADWEVGVWGGCKVPDEHCP
jgi:hypothetical protein